MVTYNLCDHFCFNWKHSIYLCKKSYQMKKAALILLAFAISISSSCQQTANNSLNTQKESEQISATIQTNEFADKLNGANEVLLLDVRTPEEFECY
jgi:hypothetical protein